MPKNYASGVRLIKRRRKGLKFFAVSMVIVAISVCLGEVISSMLKYGVVNIFSQNVSKLNEYTVYALSFGEYSTLDAAQQMANASSLRGAGGYIWSSGGKYYVLGLVYPTNDAAKSVSEGITEYSTAVMPISYGKVKLQFDELSSTELKTVQDAMEYLKDLYAELYNNCIKLDTKEMTSIACSNNINYFKSVAKTHVANIMRINNKLNSSKLSDLIDGYIMIIDSLDNCSEKLLASSESNYVSKYTLCEVVILSLNTLNKL